jgi:hypothetical protein
VYTHTRCGSGATHESSHPCGLLASVGEVKLHEANSKRLEIGVHNKMEEYVDWVAVYINAIGGRECDGKQPRGELESAIANAPGFTML